MAENVQTMWNKVQICANTNTVQNNKNAKLQNKQILCIQDRNKINIALIALMCMIRLMIVVSR